MQLDSLVFGGPCIWRARVWRASVHEELFARLS